MRLNTKGRYAVMAMADMARHGGETPISMAEIAERQDISQAYLEQLFVKLRRAGLVTSVRGPGGGYILSRPAKDIAIAEIMKAVGEPLDMTRCPDEPGSGCMDGAHCLTHELWQALGDHILGFLDRVNLDDVISGRITPGLFGDKGEGPDSERQTRRRPSPLLSPAATADGNTRSGARP